mgnify:CR=1 FL=1
MDTAGLRKKARITEKLELMSAASSPAAWKEGEVAALQMRDAAQRVQERLMAPLNAQERVDLMSILSKVVYNHQDPAGTSGA